MARRMKRSLLVASVFVCITLGLACISSFANDAQTAESITLDSPMTYTYGLGDSQHYYKFVPKTTGYYEANAEGFIKGDSFLEFLTASGKSVAITDWNQYSGKLHCACYLQGGSTYYIKNSQYTFDRNEKITSVTTISVHKHSFDRGEAEEFNGFRYMYCQCPRCNYRKYEIWAKPVMKKLSSGKKAFTVAWDYYTYTTGKSYMQIQYSTSSKFTTKTSKTVKVSKDALKKTVKNLKKGKKYYVRMRSCSELQQDVGLGVGETSYFYSPWTKAKSVKTK